jgi:hypothetical protein
MRIATATAAHTSATNIVSLRSSIAAGFRHKPPRHINVTLLACHKKRRPTILLAHEKPYTSVTRIDTDTAAHTSATDILPLRSSIAARRSHKPPRHIEVSIGTRRQKRRPTILLAHEKQYTSVTRIDTAAAAHTSPTNIVPLRSSIAARRSHKPPRHIEVTILTCNQKRCVTILLAQENHTPASRASPQTPQLTHQQRTLFRSDRASLPAEVTSHRATSR